VTVDSLEKLEAAFAKWRRQKKHIRERVPEEMLRRARGAAKTHGQQEVARVVALDARYFEEPRLIVVDALDEALELDPATRSKCGTIVSLLEKKAKRLPPWLRVLATSRNNDEVLRPLRQGFTIRVIDAESADNLRDLDAFIRGRCARPALRGRIAAAGQEPTAFTETLLPKCGGKILYAVRVLDDVECGELSVDEVDELPPGMDGFYQDAFTRRFAKRGIDYAPVRDLLGILAIAQEPLAPATLGRIAGIDDVEVVRRLKPLPDFLRRREGRIGFDHFSIAEWLTRIDPQTLAPRADSYAVDVPAAKRRMGDWIESRIAAGTADAEPYLVRHLPAHLEDDDIRQAALRRLLFDFRWLDARLRARSVAALIGDAALLEDEAGRVLVTALRNSAHVVQRTADQLAPGGAVLRIGDRQRRTLQLDRRGPGGEHDVQREDEDRVGEQRAVLEQLLELLEHQHAHLLAPDRDPGRGGPGAAHDAVLLRNSAWHSSSTTTANPAIQTKSASSMARSLRLRKLPMTISR